MGIWREKTGSKGSSRSHRENHKNLTRFVVSNHESSLLAFHLPLTTREEQCRREYEKNPVARRKNGARSAVGCVQYKSQHRGGNRPIQMLMTTPKFWSMFMGLPSLRHEELVQSHYPAPVLDCFPESQVTKIVQQLPSCVQSFLALALEPLPIVMALAQRRTPCRHE